MSESVRGLEKGRWKAMIIALAGRRIDAGDAESARFPLKNVVLVQQKLDALFGREAATALVSSGACGADLVALTVAGARQMRRRVVLPFARDEFRTSSVTDRPGDWGPVYDRVLAELDKTGDVVTLAGHAAGDAAYAAANDAILQEAATLARQDTTEVVAVLVWDGTPRGATDMTVAFGEDARKRGCRVEEVNTL
jgi:hypothetical protein